MADVDMTDATDSKVKPAGKTAKLAPADTTADSSKKLFEVKKVR